MHIDELRVSRVACYLALMQRIAYYGAFLAFNLFYIVTLLQKILESKCYLEFMDLIASL